MTLTSQQKLSNHIKLPHMPLEVTNLKRKFSFKKDGKKVDLADPNTEFSVEEVMLS